MATAPEGGSQQLGDVPHIGRTILVAGTAALGGFLFGYDTAVINGAVKAVGEAFHANAFLLGLAVAIALIGAAIGAWTAGGLADRFGRIRVMIIAARTVPDQRVRLRVRVQHLRPGVLATDRRHGRGCRLGDRPRVHRGDFPAALRGRLASLQQMAIVVGIFVSLLVDYALVATSGAATAPLWFGLDTWRWMFLSLAVRNAARKHADAATGCGKR